MTTLIAQDEKKQKFLAALEFQGVGGMDALRKEARAILDALPLPTTRNEAWKYTRVGKIVSGDWNVEAGNLDSIDAYALENVEATQLVFVNGFFNENLSTIVEESGVEIRSIFENTSEEIGKHIDVEGRFFTALNTAHITGGCQIHVAKNVTAHTPIHLIHLTTNANSAAFPRHLITAAQGAQLDVVIGYHGTENVASYTNSIIEVQVGANARVHIDQHQKSPEQAFLMTDFGVTQADDSLFHLNTITGETGWVRNDVGVKVKGKNCTSNLYGTYVLRGKQHLDNHTVIDHIEPHCESNELYKGILHDKSTGVFNGKVFVRQDAQKTNAFQQNANILMSDDSTMNSKPELEIYADDVKCSHGSTTGQFDDEAIFYLKARGLSDPSARQMLAEAFVGEVTENVKYML